jgi:hypothetical protein
MITLSGTQELRELRELRKESLSFSVPEFFSS